MSTLRSVPKLASFILALLTVCALGEVGAAEGPRDGDTRARRFEGDQSLNTFTATLTATEAADMCLQLEDPATTTTTVVTVTEDGDTQASTAQSFFSGSPVYRKPGDGTLPWIDYDDSGNFLLWRTVEAYSRSTPEGRETLKLSLLHLISPEGVVITESPAHQQLERSSPASLGGGASEVDLMMLALGQGFSRYLREKPVVEKGVDGQLRGRVAGKFGRSQEGTWELVYAAEGEELIRKATFYGAGQTRPALLVVNEGVVRAGGMTLARSGEITLGRPGQERRLSVRLQTLRPVADSKLLAEVNDRIERPLPQGSDAINLRDGMFERIVIGTDPGGDPVPTECCQCGSVSKVFNECGHLRASTVCASDWCIKNEINTASCFKKAASGTTNCRIRAGAGPLVVQRLILLPNGGCPTGGNAVKYATKLTTHSSCSSCEPGTPTSIRTACDISSCPAGEEACSSNRGTRMTCY